MKVCMLATDFPVKRGGASVTYGGAGACMAQLVEGVAGEGVEVTVVTRREQGDYSELFDVPVHRTSYLGQGLRPAKVTHSLWVLPTLYRVLGNEKFDLIHSHNPLAGYPGNRAGKKFGIPHLTTMHGPWARVRLNPVSRKLCRMTEKKVLSNADHITCDSRKLAEDVKDWYSLPEAKVTAIQNAVETDRFSPGFTGKAKAREELGVKTEDRIVLYTGRFLAEKGIKYLLEAIEEVTEKSKDISFLLVGGGFDEHLVSGWLKKTKNKDRVHTLPYIEYEKMPYAYLASDVLVQPSLAEGLSRSILEAMACGLPVIATDVGGNPELVSLENGFLVKPSSSRGMVEAILNIFSDDKTLSKMGESSRRRVVSEFSVEKRIKSFIRLYGRLV